jgi:choline-sulfatase
MSSARPNILVIMVDQLAGTLFPDGPAAFLKAPNLKRLAERSLRFKNCYAASPLCAPARASFMSGQLPSRTRVYDNAAEFASDIPTYAHYLRRAGYQTVLSGKMHFVGPDQLHGFEERLTTDIYPADFGWTPDYSRPNERIDWWYHNLGSVTGAGSAEITNQLEYDDEVAFQATQKLYDFARRADARPWCLTVSFTHPHDPYVARRRYFELYEGASALDPRVAPIAFEAMDPHSQRLCLASDFRRFAIEEQHVRRSRQAYFGNVSYIDEKVGELLDVLARCRMDEETVVVFVSDHGDMLGERGLWFKMNFFEGSCRVPLMIAAPSLKPGLVDSVVSAMDVAPTIADLAGVNVESVAPWSDGTSVLTTVRNGNRSAPVLMEYAAEGSIAPLVAIREGVWKFVSCTADPPLLFNLDHDPDELDNLASRPEFAPVAAAFAARIAHYWNVADFDAAVRASQARRHLVYSALRNGAYYPWDYQPLQKASERYMRNHMDLNVLEDNKRFPRGE